MSRLLLSLILVAMTSSAFATDPDRTRNVKGRIVLIRREDEADSTTSLVEAISRGNASIETVAKLKLGLSSIRVSSDGKRLAFIIEHDNRECLRVLNFADAEKSATTLATDADWIGGWSPDGTKIIFGAGDRGQRSNSILDLATKEVRPIALPMTEVIWDWSPDGKELLTISDSQPERNQLRQIQRANLDGTKLTRLTDGLFDGICPRFSPDGRKVLFSSTRTRRVQVFVMDRDGQNVTQLTSFNDRSTGNPCWSPDGKEVLCRSYKTGPVVENWSYSISDAHLILMNADGTDHKEFLPPQGNLAWFFDWR